MSHKVYFIHENGIREYDGNTVREVYQPMPQVPQSAWEYLQMLQDFADRLSGVPPTPAISPSTQPREKS